MQLYDLVPRFSCNFFHFKFLLSTTLNFSPITFKVNGNGNGNQLGLYACMLIAYRRFTVLCLESDGKRWRVHSLHSWTPRLLSSPLLSSREKSE